jgi:hypothetical protein
VGEATLLATAGWFGLVFATFWILGFKSELRTVPTGILVLVAVVLFPVAVARWWMFPRIAVMYSRREARAVSTAFAIFSPVASGVGIVLGGVMGGGYADHLRSGLFVVAGVFLGTTLVSGTLILVACALALHITRLAMSVERID